MTGAIGAVLTAAPLLAAETILILNDGIAATLAFPDGGTLVPAVLMLHGFGSSRDEVGGLYAQQAAALEAQGIASLRIDFQGFGKSDGDTGASTIDQQLENAITGLDALMSTQGVDPDRIGLMGFSLGGGVAMLIAQSEAITIKSMVTWSSVGDFEVDMVGTVGQAAFDRAAAEGIVGLDLGWRTIALKQGFFESLSGRDLTAAIASFPGAYLAIAGSDDFSAAYVEGFVAAAAGSPKEGLIIPGGDHIFGVFGPDAAMSQGVVSRTAEWFASTL